MTGCTPRLSISSSRCNVSTRIPEYPRARVLARMSIMARVVGMSKAPRPHRMTAENVALEEFYLVRRNNAILKSAKARGNAIRHRALG